MRSSKVVLLVVLILGPLTGLPQVSETDDKSQVVRGFLDAFNAHDTAAMAALVADDVEWLSVSDSAISIEVEGKAAFAVAMNEYFGSCPTCRWGIHGLMSSSERVSVVEVASWVGLDGLRSQRSMAVYEFSGLLIQRVYYFPEEREPNHRNPETR